MGQTPARKVIEANEFVLRDASGQARARLSMEATDRPTLSFYKDKTTITASRAAGDEPFLTLQRAGTNEQVQLGANKTFVGLGIYEKEIRAGLSVQKGAPGLDLFNENAPPWCQRCRKEALVFPGTLQRRVLLHPAFRHLGSVTCASQSVLEIVRNNLGTKYPVFRPLFARLAA
jgi:hypothetical protein